MKKVIFLFTFIGFVSFCSCTKNEDPINLPDISIENISNMNSMVEGDTIYLKAKIKSLSQSSFTWYVGDEIKNVKDSLFKFTSSEIGTHTISLVCSNMDGQKSVSIDIEIYGKYKYGTFILNEGNMTKESGSLLFISPKGEIMDSVYLKVNNRNLGNVTQDLFIRDNKIYIIAQNGKKSASGADFENDGILVVANAETLKKEISYTDELSDLSWPTHIAVLDEANIFIRDNKGIHLFNPTKKELKLIEGTKGASKNRMLVVKDKVFAIGGKNIFVLKSGKTIVDTIKVGESISGIVKSDDGNIWIATTGTSHKIAKIKPTDYSLIKENTLTEGSVTAGWGATPGICAKGDTLYFSGATTKIYRHIFSTGETKFMVDAKEMVEDSNMAYNNIGVHPLTGEVYMTTIKGYGMNYLINNISVFNFSKSTPKLSYNYKNYTRFPAGIFFTYNFE